MSYILDALKKSELQRTGEESPEWTEEEVKTPELSEPIAKQRVMIGALLVLVPVLFGLVYWVFLQADEPSVNAEQNLNEVAKLEPAQSDMFSEIPSDGNLGEKPSQSKESNSVSPTPTKAVVTTTTAASKNTPNKKMNSEAFYAAQGIVKNTTNNENKKTTPSNKKKSSVIFSDVPLDAEPATKRATKPKPKVSAQKIAVGKAVVTIYELPEKIQKQIPELIFAGHVYSSDKKKRHIMINGQKLREGDAAEPGIILKKITLLGAVFSYKKWRFSLDALQDWEGNR